MHKMADKLYARLQQVGVGTCLGGVGLGGVAGGDAVG